jgi:hypothetical protein
MSSVPRRAGRAGSLALAVTLLASAAVASVVISYTTPSTVSLTVKPPPVAWAAGPDSSGNTLVSSWTLSSNATYYSLTVKPVPEANVTWGNLTTLSNVDSQAWSVTVTASSLSAYPKVVGARMEFYAYGTNALVGAMNLTAASPSVSLGSLAAGASVYEKAYIQLATGTGASDLPSSIQVSLSIS